MFELNISTRDAKLTVKEIMTTGSVGMTIKMTFSADWSNLHRVACFENGHKQIVIDEDDWTANKVEIPHEMFFTAGAVVKVGVYGYRIEDGEKVIAIPTIYAELGKVERGANGLGDSTAKATPTIIEKLIEDVEGKQDRLVAGQNITIQDNVISASGGGSLDVDTQMSDTSENAVQNKVIKGYVDDALQSASEQVEQFFELKSDLENDVNEIIDGVVVKKSEISETPTLGDENPVSSDGVARSIGNLYTLAVESFVAKSEINTEFDETSTNPVSNEAIARQFNSYAFQLLDLISEIYASKEDVEGKQDTLTPGSGISIVNNVISATGGGGGTANPIELIETITITEPTASIERDNTPGGVAYNFRKIIVTLVNYTASKQIKFGTNMQYFEFGNNAPNYAGYQVDLMAEWYEGNYQKYFLRQEQDNAFRQDYSSAFRRSEGGYITINGIQYAGPQDAIKAVRVSCPDNFPAGCVIKIYGVRK